MDVEVVNRPSLGDVERLALGNTLRDVEEDDVAQLPHRREVSQGSADHSSADKRDLLPSHEAAFNLSVCFSGGGSWGVAASRSAAPD